ncbi:LOW QUALITY PROTEIN: replicase polyprotein 1a [Elysia marginata]|uniref:Replicase polyprotein 1a n=1 Tax=Elysia marginata TaxID=1093978 RepID=A0AAV4EU44_9GAST|nr:LOW QUALITY PROTEIN: replicase polyprotein 1a [Elysia marginata]
MVIPLFSRVLLVSTVGEVSSTASLIDIDSEKAVSPVSSRNLRVYWWTPDYSAPGLLADTRLFHSAYWQTPDYSAQNLRVYRQTSGFSTPGLLSGPIPQGLSYHQADKTIRCGQPFPGRGPGTIRQTKPYGVDNQVLVAWSRETRPVSLVTTSSWGDKDYVEYDNCDNDDDSDNDDEDDEDNDDEDDGDNDDEDDGDHDDEDDGDNDDEEDDGDMMVIMVMKLLFLRCGGLLYVDPDGNLIILTTAHSTSLDTKTTTTTTTTTTLVYTEEGGEGLKSMLSL